MGNNEFDLDSIVADFDENYDFDGQDQDQDELEQDEELDELDNQDQDDLETDEEDESEQDEEDLEEEEEEEENTSTSKDSKQNRAFAELRRKAQENEQAAQFLMKLAEQANVTPEEIIRRFEQKALEQQAQQQGVPVEVMQRIQALEQENVQVKSTLVGEKLDSQIKSVREKYKASDDEIKATFQEMFENGVDPRLNPNVNFEKFYRAANFEKILESKVKEAKQSSLEKKKKRQEEAAIPNGESATQISDDIDDLVNKDVAEILENW